MSKVIARNHTLLVSLVQGPYLIGQPCEGPYSWINLAQGPYLIGRPSSRDHTSLVSLARDHTLLVNPAQGPYVIGRPCLGTNNREHEFVLLTDGESTTGRYTYPGSSLLTLSHERLVKARPTDSTQRELYLVLTFTTSSISCSILQI